MRRQTRQRKEEEEEGEEEVSPIEPLGWLALNLASSQATSRGRKLSLNSFLATFLVTTFWIARPATFSLLEHRVVCVARLQAPTRGQEILAATMALENKFLSNSQEDIEQPTQETDTQETEEDNNFSDDLSDSGDDSDVEFAAVPKAFETVAPRNLKRTYGIIVDDLRSERRIKTAKLDEQLQYLRHIIPDTYRDEKAHVLFDAYHYIMRLQRRVEDLNTELIPLQNSHTETSETPTVQSSRVPSQEPTVEVTRKEGKLEVRIVCVNRPGLLVDIMGVLESSRLTVLQASIACHDDILFEALSLESDEGAATSDHELFIEDEGVKANLFRAISQDRADCALQ